MATSTIKKAKLNSTQIAELTRSGIDEAYARQNFVNITKSVAPILLKATSQNEILLKGSSLLGGLADVGLNVYKPKTPRQSKGKAVKYESVAKPTLIEVLHPPNTVIDESATYFVEGLKKGVAVAQRTKCRVFWFAGLTIGRHLIDHLNMVDGRKRLVLDNDNSISAINMARALVEKLEGNWEIAAFSYFKGIDDAFAGGVNFEQIKFIPLVDWCVSTSGYIDGYNYTFCSSRFEDVVFSESTRLLMIQGAKGAGKSWALSQLTKRYRALGREVFVITHRINLSRKNALEFRIQYIDDEGYTSGSCGLCIDSILKLNIPPGAVVIIDEVCQVIDHLVNSDTLKYKRQAVFRKFQEMLVFLKETCGLVAIADADLDKKNERFIKELGGFTKDETYLIRNSFIFDKGDAYHSSGIGKLTAKGVSARKYPTDIAAKILKEAKEGKRLFCCLSAQSVESRYSTQVMEYFLIANGIPANDIIRIDSTTVGDPNHPAYKAAERIAEICDRYRVILASPSLNTGVDVQFKGFDYVIGIFSGVLDSNGARQFLSRVRDWNVPRIFYAPDIRQNFGGVALTTKSEFQLFAEAQIQSLQLIDPEWYNQAYSEPRERVVEATKAYYLTQSWESNKEKFEYAKRLKLGLEKEGFKVKGYQSEITESEATALYNQLGEIKDLLETKEQLLTQELEVKTEEEAKALYDRTSLSLEEKCSLKGYEIRRKYNLEPTPEVQTKLKGDTPSVLENSFAALDPEGIELTKALWEKADYWSKGREDKTEIAHDFIKRNARMLRIKALNAVGFFDVVLNPFDKDDAANLLTELRKEKLNLKLFPSLPTKETNQSVKAIKAIAGLFNLRVEQVGQKHKGDRTYIAVDAGLILSDTFDGIAKDVKPEIFKFWTEKRKKQVEDWQAFKADIALVKLGLILDDSKKLPLLSSDFKYSKLSTRARTLPIPTQPDYRMVCQANASEFKLWLTAQPEVAMDVETYGDGKKGGLNHINGSIRLLQLATTDTIWIVERGNFDLVRDEVTALLSNPGQRKVGHNFMFDLRFLRKEFGVLARNCADTMLGSRCLLGDMGAAQVTSHSLGQACENFLGIAVDKTEQKSDWGGGLTSDQLAYAAKDPWLTFVLYKRLEALTKQPSLILLPFPEMMAYEAWEVENRFLFAAQQMEDTGYKIDRELLTKIKTQYQAVRDELMGKWQAPYLPTQKGKLQQYLNEKHGLSLKSLGKATAAENSDIPEIKLMQQICACDAILHTLNSIEQQIEINQGRVQPYFKVLTGTGRTSSGATSIEKCLINLQSLAAKVNPVLTPKHLQGLAAMYRNIKPVALSKAENFGYDKLKPLSKFLKADFKKGEWRFKTQNILEAFTLPVLKSVFKTDLIIDLPASHGRISAELGNDENALKAYTDPSIDMHCMTASAISKAVFPDENYTTEWVQANKKSGTAKSLRDTAKNTYYGWLNGAGVSTIQRQIKSNLQINADKGACQKALEEFQKVFSGTTEYAKGKLKELEQNQFIVNGNVCGWMEFAGTYLCWRLGSVGGDLKVPATKAFAGIWSRTESVLMKRACYRIAEKFDSMPEWNSRLQNFIHDEINAVIGNSEAAIFAHSVVKEEFGSICQRTIAGFDPLEKCYPLNKWSDKA